MAKVSCKIKFGRFVADKRGYAALMDTGPMQSIIRGKAASVRSAANSALSSEGYRLSGFETKPAQGKLAKGCVVRTKTDHARRSNAKRNTLLKALNAAKE